MNLFFKLLSSNCPRLTRSAEPNPNLHQASWWPVRGEKVLNYIRTHTAREGGRERERGRGRKGERLAGRQPGQETFLSSHCANLVNELSFWARCCVSLCLSTALAGSCSLPLPSAPFLHLSLPFSVSLCAARANTSGHKYSTFAEGVAVGLQLGVEFGKLPSAQITVHWAILATKSRAERRSEREGERGGRGRKEEGHQLTADWRHLTGFLCVPPDPIFMWQAAAVPAVAAVFTASLLSPPLSSL